MIIDKDKPFRSGLRFESTDAWTTDGTTGEFKTGELSGIATHWR